LLFLAVGAIGTTLGFIGARAWIDRVDQRLGALEKRPTAMNVYISAMDSQSILDHSHDIAKAVQEEFESGKAVGLADLLRSRQV
jgi:hypothetical protein